MVLFPLVDLLGHAVMQLEPMQNFGEVIAAELTEAPTVTLSAMKFATPSPPDFTWLVALTFTGPGVLPLGGAWVGPVQAKAYWTPTEKKRAMKRTFADCHNSCLEIFIALF